MIYRGRTTERTLYPYIMKMFEEHGARAVSEVKFNSEPDIVVDGWLGEKWIVSVKIGDAFKQGLLKKAFIQYITHMRESKIEYGMIIFYPDSIRKIRPVESELIQAIKTTKAYFIVLNPQLELNYPLPDALREIEKVVRGKEKTSLTLKTVVSVLREQIVELMDRMNIDEKLIMELYTNPELFYGINPVKEEAEKRKKHIYEASKFLSAYIFLSQMLFLKFYVEKRPTFFGNIDMNKLTREDVRKLFQKIKHINYRPVFEYDVLDGVPEELIRDTFKLVFGLQVENIRYDLPGRLFHELMSKTVRKLLAAFYTRPIAAYLLAHLTIDDPNMTVFDPACGSGTILVSAYRRKRELWEAQKLGDNPHKIFVEKQIFGCDIMPFAVHITNANLAAMDPLTTIELTQIANEDSLKIDLGQKYKPGYIVLSNYIPELRDRQGKVNMKVLTRTGEFTEITFQPVDTVLMNPPFTKIERGIKKYISTDRYEDVVSGEVGLWGYFIALADAFLKENGVFGAVIPINILRGRESEKVRKIVFQQWLPLYIIKATKNYGFSEWAEYRDILLIAKKTKIRPQDHKVKFCLIKKDLNKLEDKDVREIADKIKNVGHLRSELLDIDSYPLSDVLKRFKNMMPFISGPSFSGKDALRRIVKESEEIFSEFPRNYFKEGYGPRPKGTSKFMFITNPIRENYSLEDGRLKEAFLILEGIDNGQIIAKTPIGIEKFRFNKKHFLPSLRTPVGLNSLDVTDSCDYVAKEPYENIEKIMKLSDFDKSNLPKNYWNNYLKKEYNRAKCQAFLSRRINPYSPNQSLIAFYSDVPLVVSDLFHCINEEDDNVRKAVVVLMNSIFFLSYFFYLKEESTGRYIDIRQHDIYEMILYPKDRHQIRNLVNVFEKYKQEKFPSLRNQLDKEFDLRYSIYLSLEREKQLPLPYFWGSLSKHITPHELRLKFDIEVAKAVGANLTEHDIIESYKAIIEDMLVTKALRKD